MLTEDGAAIEVAWARHHARLERLLTRITHDPEEARDLATEAFVRLSLELAAGRSPRNAEAWLSRVGSNLACSRGRRLTLARRRSADLPQPRDPEPPDALVLLAETTRELGIAISSLSASERVAIVLAANGCGASEIAAALGRTPAAARTLLCRARAKVRRRLNAQER
jgi:RNA polymerase sigma factor (sigma-70 family)